MKIKKYIGVLLVFLYAFNLIGQEPNIAQIKMVSNVKDNFVQLRWAPDKPAAWVLLNKYGYRIEKYRVFYQGETQLADSSNLILLDTIQPLKYEKWEFIIDTNDNAAIAAQAIYGETFELKNSQTGFWNMVNQAKEIENRFSFALVAANNSFSLAKYMALGFDDFQIKNDEKYLYKIISLVPKGLYAIDTAFVYINPQVKSSLPFIHNLTGNYSGDIIRLKWPFIHHSDYYVNYRIERSLDSLNFTPLSDNSFVSLNKSKQNTGFNYYVDSVRFHGKKYYYRIKGRSVFGENGPYSNVISIRTYESFNVKPEIIQTTIENNKIIVEWDFPESFNQINEGFRIYTARNIKDQYNVLTKEPLNSMHRKYVIKNPGSVNYILVSAENLGGEQLFSLPAFVQFKDDIPPVVPKGLKTKVSKSGKVYLNWRKSMESDIAGYRVYYSTKKEGEYTQLTSKLLESNHFTHKFPLNWLNSKVYMKVLAEDLYYNFSELSEALEVALPDTIAPSAPVIRKYDVIGEEIKIWWNNSCSMDVKQHALIRYGNKRIDTLIVYDKQNLLNEFTDKHAGNENTYKLIAFDDYDNYSVSNRVIVKSSKRKSNKVDFNIKKDLSREEILLDFKETIPFKKIVIYKAIGDEKIMLYKTITSYISEFRDNKVSINQQYKYRLKIYTVDNEIFYSKMLTIKY